RTACRLRLLAAVRRRSGARRAPSLPPGGVPGAAHGRATRRAMIVNQWVPAAHRGDAIGDSARRVRDLLRAMGHRSDLYALTIDDDVTGDVLPFDDGPARAGDVTIFHYALPSPMTAAFGTLPRGRILQYHNVTPA